ncbi:MULTISPECIES: twin-arginine translocase TatA/TatE family subunit [Citrobacter]|uniref:twin-arginine translocase TatA/TatE family subunit n=1 Tax=Citrobacter TaxID=544 RepID=UPI000E3CF81A|nr:MULTISPECIES: twin-arginine translocase TatA/TatE family subunit [Citrobacter]MBD0826530.1 twin-arginine translocase TatA/TatE family subunit [Citrobacter sp. C1]RFU93258.1 twin-arginine translocase TatA/TatE family subunit [Citrobacter gillenii]
MAGISIWKLIIIAGIVIMLFGTKRLRSLGGDLGESLRDFKKSFASENNNTESVEELKPPLLSINENDKVDTERKK